MLVTAIWIIGLVILWLLVDRSLKIDRRDVDAIRRPDSKGDSD